MQHLNKRKRIEMVKLPFSSMTNSNYVLATSSDRFKRAVAREKPKIKDYHRSMGINLNNAFQTMLQR